MANNKKKSNRSNSMRAKKPKGNKATYGNPLRKTKKKTRGKSASNMKAVCSNTDPFCKHADGAKQFGSGSQSTIPIQCKTSGFIRTNGTGRAAIQIRGSIKNTFRGVSTWTVNKTATWETSQDVPEYADISSYDGQYRVVSFGVHLYNQTAATDSQGIVTLQTTSNFDDVMDLRSSMYIDSKRQSLAGADLYWIGKPQDLRQDFIDVTDTSNSYSCLTIMVEGGAYDTAVLGYDIVLNIEWYPGISSIFSRIATPAQIANPLIDQAITNTSSWTDYAYDHLPSAELTKKAGYFLGHAAATYLGAPPLLTNGVSAILELD